MGQLYAVGWIQSGLLHSNRISECNAVPDMWDVPPSCDSGYQTTGYTACQLTACKLIWRNWKLKDCTEEFSFRVKQHFIFSISEDITSYFVYYTTLSIRKLKYLRRCTSFSLPFRRIYTKKSKCQIISFQYFITQRNMQVLKKS